MGFPANEERSGGFIVLKSRKLPGMDRRAVKLRDLGKRTIGIMIDGDVDCVGATVKLDDLIDAVAALSAEDLHG